MLNRHQSHFHRRTVWTSGDLASDLNKAAEIFRQQRMQEPLDIYAELFEEAQSTVEDLLEQTVDLLSLDAHAVDVLTDPKKLEGFRYFAGPPISADDLATLADASLSPKSVSTDPELANRLIQIIRICIDRRRFPWLSEGREPTPTERDIAVIASAALMAAQRAATMRRNDSKQEQETNVRLALEMHGLQAHDIPGGTIQSVRGAPPPGSFCPHETVLGDRKADLIVTAWDGRIVPIECKVSNSSTNSIKRLNNDAAVKAETWLKDFGATQVVPVAMLSGVYKLKNLETAQARGLTLYWAHRVSDLTDWIDCTR